MKATRLFVLAAALVVALCNAVDASAKIKMDKGFSASTERMVANLKLTFHGELPKNLKAQDTEIVLPFDASMGALVTMTFRHPDPDAHIKVVPKPLQVYRQVIWGTNPNVEPINRVRFSRKRLRDGVYADDRTPVYTANDSAQALPLREGDILSFKKITFKGRDLALGGKAVLRITVQGIPHEGAVEFPYPPVELSPLVRIIRLSPPTTGGDSMSVYIATGDFGVPFSVTIRLMGIRDGSRNKILATGTGWFSPNGSPLYTTLGLHRQNLPGVPTTLVVAVDNDETGEILAAAEIACGELPAEFQHVCGV